MQVTFLGASGTVTGSKYLVETGASRILIDCGLFQGLKSLRRRNWKAPMADPGSLDAVVLTHAHLDHTGYLPRLVMDGFKGPIYCNAPTTELAKILLRDSGRLQEEEARYANKKGFSKHHPAKPLYDEAAALEAAGRLETVKLGEALSIGELTVRSSIAGHILGATSLFVEGGGTSVLFSGDLGRPNDVMIPPPADPADPDWVVMESTYGDESHQDVDPLEALARVVRQTEEKRGALLIPSFAVGRAQSLLYCLHEIFNRRLAPRMAVFLDSPMATNVTDLYRKYTEYHRLTRHECEAVCSVATFARSVEESRRINTIDGPRIVISASGMLTGGRVLHHLKRLGPDQRNTILLPGFQAAGTRGAALAHGKKSVKVHGKYVPINAEVLQLGMFSAHADQPELLDWLRRVDKPPREVFLVHGELEASDALRVKIEEHLGVPARAAEHGETVSLSGS